MQRNMAPVADYARARLAPWIAALSRQIVPMERFGVEFTIGPFGKIIHHFALAAVFLPGAGTVGRLRELIFKCLIGAHTDQESSPAVLRDTVILGVQHGPFHPIASRAVTDKLIAEQITVFAEYHPIDIFYCKRFWEHFAQDAVEFAIEIVSDVSLPFPLASLGVALAGVASDEKIGSRKRFEVADVAAFDLRSNYVFLVCVAGGLPNVVRPDDVVPKFLKGVIRAPAATKQRYCRSTCHALP